MMLKQVSVKNFRAFSEPVTVRIRPITVLIGRNSAGKSSLVKFLLMLRQTLEVREDAFLATEGRHVHLGPFRGLKNVNSSDRYLRFALTIVSEDLPPEPLRQIPKTKSGRAPLQVQKTADDTFDLHFRLQKVTRTGQSATFKVESDVMYAKQPTRGKHSVAATLDGESVFERTSHNLRQCGLLHFPPVSDSPEDVFDAFLSSNFLGGVRYELRTIRHLSPVREESQRAVVVASPPPDDVGHCGEYSMPHLHRIWLDDDKQAEREFIRRHIRAVAGIDELGFDTALRGYLAHCRAKNRETGAVSSLADFGFGVSQCLPIFIQGAMMNKDQLLMVEQPEAQLHPTAQLDMGTFFVDLWNTRKVPSLIETHSAQVLLRIRKLVAYGTLPASDVSIAYFHVEDGAVTVTNLDILENGGLEKGLPMEFFGADILEALDLGANE